MRRQTYFTPQYGPIQESSSRLGSEAMDGWATEGKQQKSWCRGSSRSWTGSGERRICERDGSYKPVKSHYDREVGRMRLCVRPEPRRRQSRNMRAEGATPGSGRAVVPLARPSY